MVESTEASPTVRGEKPEVVLARIQEKVPAWATAVTSLDQVEIRKLSGLSNACYKVAVKDEVELSEPRVVLYRKFECQIVDKQVEAAIFQAMSNSGLGPKLLFQNDEYRIESFFEGRPLTIWELRNPFMMKLFVKAIFNMHTKSGAAEAIQAFKPMDATKLGIDESIEDWGPAAVARIVKIKAKLTPESNQDHAAIMNAIIKLEETYLKDGYQDVFRALVPRDKIVLSHNDAQENNILSSLEDATEILLIDYEYGSWNPQYFDLACFLNEWVCDNAYPRGTGTYHYLENWPTQPEIESITREYFLLSKQKERGDDSSLAVIESSWSMDNAECAAAVQQVKQCMVLVNYYWGVWPIMLLTEADETDVSAFHWNFIIGRCKLQKKCIQEFGIGQV